MKYDKLSRRHFLQGFGGSFLALPFLPSIAEGAPGDPSEKFMVMFWSNHGGIYDSNMYPLINNPAVSGQLTQSTLYSSQMHIARYGRLINVKTTRASNLSYYSTRPGADIADCGEPHDVNGYGLNPSQQDMDAGAARVSPVVGSFVSDAMLAKMNIIAGLDMMHDSGHTRGQAGNFAARDGGFNGQPHISSIDYLIANFPAFYGTSAPVAKSMVIFAGGANEDISGEVTSSGYIQNVNNAWNLGEAFSRLFGSLTPSTPTAASKKSFLLNNVYEDYRRLARGAYGAGRRIGQEDRSRLEQFMTSLDTIIRGLGATPVASCTVPSVSPNDNRRLISPDDEQAINATDMRTIMGLYNELIASAIQCGRSKAFIVVVPNGQHPFFDRDSANRTFSDDGRPVSTECGFAIDNSDAHQGLYHRCGRSDRQRYLADGARFYFQNAFYDLMQKLNSRVSPINNGTLLDQGMMFWTQESGASTHNGNDLPMITAGSAGGFFNTGNFVDYRNLSRTVLSQYGNTRGPQGLPYNRFLATVLQSMGLAPANYELAPTRFQGSSGRVPVNSSGRVPGYGHPYQEQFRVENVSGLPYDYLLNDMSVKLPIVTT